MALVIHNMNNITKERITSIDALRAITLFGILLVHTIDVFGWQYDIAASSWGGYANHFIALLLRGRCNAVFGILFGVSFYLILRNPNYSSRKFVWRCFLLFLIGLFNKIFYTYDALMWYGIWGMALVFFRKLSVKKLWISFAILYVLHAVIQYSVDLREIIFASYIPVERYASSKTLGEVIGYPVWRSALDYVHAIVNHPLYTFNLFLLGYCIARTGIIDNLKKYVTIKHLIIFTVLYLILSVLGIKFELPEVKSIGYLCGAFCYAELFLLIYYKTYPLLRFLEPYGKLGLTNYSMQGIIGVIFVGLIIIPYRWSFEWFLLSMLLFYAIQLVFSIVWLKYYKYGPFEWLWRCATERKWIKNRQTETIQ